MQSGCWVQQRRRVGVFVTADNDEIINVDNRIMLARASELLRKRINEKHLEQVKQLSIRRTHTSMKVLELTYYYYLS